MTHYFPSVLITRLSSLTPIVCPIFPLWEGGRMGSKIFILITSVTFQWISLGFKSKMRTPQVHDNKRNNIEFSTESIKPNCWVNSHCYYRFKVLIINQCVVYALASPKYLVTSTWPFLIRYLIFLNAMVTS